MELEMIVISKISQTQKENTTFSHMQNLDLKKKKT
jgi:hypothetical protein